MMCVSARPRESRVQTVILGQKWAGRCRRRSLVPHLLAPAAIAEYHPRHALFWHLSILYPRGARALLPAALGLPKPRGRARQPGWHREAAGERRGVGREQLRL